MTWRTHANIGNHFRLKAKHIHRPRTHRTFQLFQTVTSINEPIDVFYVINYIEQTL